MNISIVEFRNQLQRKVATWFKCFAFLFTAALLNPPPGNAATPVCGDIEDPVWALEGSPYLITCDVNVASLVIEPGVVVQFEGNYVFRVEGGVLRAKGARFTTTNSAVGWQGIWFIDSPPGSFFQDCIIEYSGNSGVRITNSAPSGGGVPAFTNCTIINNSSPDYGGGIDADLRSGDLVLDNCLIGTNACGIHGGGINAILNNGKLKIVHCTVVSNIANATYAGGSYVGGGIRVTGDSLFLNCMITDNLCNAYASGGGQTRISYGAGIYSDTGDADFRNCRFQRNTAQSSRCCGNSASRSWGGALYFQDGRLTMQNCIVDTNTCSSTHDSSGAGIFVGSGTADIINCTIIANNTQGLYRNGGTVNCLNSILYFNNSSSDQIGGAVTATYCDIQGGYPGEGNKAVGPLLRSGTLELNAASQCIDMGNPDPRYNDICFTPPMLLASKGTQINDMGAYGGPGACCWAAPCNCPVLGELQSQATCAGMNVTFCVTATGADPLTYQWRYHGTNAAGPPMNIANATNLCLALSNVESNHIGFYSVRVSNPFCNVESNPAQLLVYAACFSLDLYPGLSITGQVGRAYCIQYTTVLSTNSVWTSLTNITLSTPEYFYLDPQPARHCDNTQAAPPRRFYRVQEGPCP